MTDVLARRDRQAAGYTAPALGLALLSVAVSYTHLDVYKRQSPWRTN